MQKEENWRKVSVEITNDKLVCMQSTLRFFKLNYMHNYHLSYMSSSSVPLICLKRSLNWTMSFEWASKICSLSRCDMLKDITPQFTEAIRPEQRYLFCSRSVNLSLCQSHVKIFEWDAKKSTINPFLILLHTGIIRLNGHTAIHM